MEESTQITNAETTRGTVCATLCKLRGRGGEQSRTELEVMSVGCFGEQLHVDAPPPHTTKTMAPSVHSPSGLRFAKRSWRERFWVRLPWRAFSANLAFLCLISKAVGWIDPGVLDGIFLSRTTDADHGG